MGATEKPQNRTAGANGVRRRWRERAGVLAFESLRYAWALRRGGDWTTARNRGDRLCRGPSGRGVEVQAQSSSDLHACHVFPSWAHALLRRALHQWPIRLQDRPLRTGEPDVTFVIPHRGRERLPLLRATVRSILGQDDVTVECLVVEQSPARELQPGDLPEAVRHVHLPHPGGGDAWHFAFAFNEGVRLARAPVAILHDGDVLAPAAYAKESLRSLAGAASVAYLHRFLFCLDAVASSCLMEDRPPPASHPPLRVRQHWKGGTRAVRCDRFAALGGFDEGFTGWGGEDVEFFDRSLAVPVWRFGYLPFVHLWHPPQAAKVDGRRERNLARLDALLAEPREERMRRARDAWARRRAGPVETRPAAGEPSP